MRNHPDTTRALQGIALWAALVPLAGCLDALGYEADVTESQSAVSEMQLQDDRIEDKHPAFDPARLVTETFDYCQVTLDKSATVTKLDIVPFAAAESALDGKLFAGRTQALAAAAAVASGEDVIPSMEVVNGYLKPFNDGLYAVVELAAENGNAAIGGSAPNKRLLLTTLLSRVSDLLASDSATAAERPAEVDAAVLLGAAQILGGDTPALSADLVSRAQARADAFTAEVRYARPIGFYTWTSALEKIFTRDRFLQNGDESETYGAYATLAFVLGQDAALLADYQRATTLYTGLTNPFVAYALDALVPYVADHAALADPNAIKSAFAAQNPARKACGGALLAFLPASRSKESDYFDESFCNGLPAGTNLLDALVSAIRSGAVDLTPGTDGGWYDYQEWALETLLLPERAPEDQHLLLTASYKKKLVETFKSILIQDRETHVKQLSVGATAGRAELPPVDVYPLFPAEPFPTFYLRTARGYRFLRTFLTSAMGAGFLDGSDRLLETGAAAAAKLSAELDQRIQLLYGLYFLSADAVGMARGEEILSDELLEIDPGAAVSAADTWLQSWRTDADVVRDPRVIIPLFDDNGTMHYSAVVGIKALKSRVEFVAGHEPVVTPPGCWTGKLVAHDYTLLVEETADVTLPDSRAPPTRDELRAICDAHTTTDEIVQALQAQ